MIHLHLKLMKLWKLMGLRNWLYPGPIEDDNGFNSYPEDCPSSTMCYDLVSSQLVLSDHSISAFQQGHQAFPLVKLKDDTYHSSSPMVPICLEHTFTQYPDLHLHMTLIDCFWDIPPSCKHSAINKGRYFLR
jgi:hypothetical protein